MTRVLRALALLAGAACTRQSVSSGPLVDDAGVAVHFTAPPRRIVSLIPATTELVFALGAGNRLVGRTTWCDFPAEAAAVPDLGNGIGPNVEAVVAARPDLVLLYRSSSNSAAADRFRSLGIPVLELRTDLIADFDRIAVLLGSVLGVQPAADSLIAWVRHDIEAARAPSSLSSLSPVLTVLTVRLSPVVEPPAHHPRLRQLPLRDRGVRRSAECLRRPARSFGSGLH